MNKLLYLDILPNVMRTGMYLTGRTTYKFAFLRKSIFSQHSSSYSSVTVCEGICKGRQMPLLKFRNQLTEKCDRFFSRSAIVCSQHEDDMFKDDPEMRKVLQEMAADFGADEPGHEGTSSSESDSESSSSSDSDSDEEVVNKNKPADDFESLSSEGIIFEEDENHTRIATDGIVFEEPISQRIDQIEHEESSSMGDDASNLDNTVDRAMYAENLDLEDILITTKQDIDNEAGAQMSDPEPEIVYEEYGFDLDEDLEDEHETVLEEEPLAVSLTRGKTGVYDVEDLVTLLREEGARDIFVAQVPKERRYVDYLVVVTGRSTRHLTAMSSLVQWVYKQRRQHSDPPTIKIEGKDTPDWFAMDLGNIALHLFLRDKRVQYDLETLWTVGPEFDEMVQAQETEDPFAAYLSDSFTLASPPASYEVDDEYKIQDTKQLPHQRMDSKLESMENVAGWHRGKRPPH